MQPKCIWLFQPVYCTPAREEEAACIAGLAIPTLQQRCGHSTVDRTYRYLRK